MNHEHAHKRPTYRLNSLAVAILGGIFLVLALQLPFGSLTNPGAGLWPTLVSASIVITSVFIMITERDGSDYEPLTRRSLISVLGFIWIAVFIVLFQFVGFTLASLIFSTVWLRFFAKESWKFTAIATAAFTIGFVVVFAVLLRVPVPHDPVLSLVTGGRF